MKETTNFYDKCKAIFNFNNDVIIAGYVSEYDIDVDLECSTRIYLHMCLDSEDLYRYFENDKRCTLIMELTGQNVLDDKTPVTIRRTFPNMKIVQYRISGDRDSFNIDLSLKKEE